MFIRTTVAWRDESGAEIMSHREREAIPPQASIEHRAVVHMHDARCLLRVAQADAMQRGLSSKLTPIDIRVVKLTADGQEKPLGVKFVAINAIQEAIKEYGS